MNWQLITTIGIFIVGSSSLIFAIWMYIRQQKAEIIFHLNKRENSDMYEFTIENRGKVKAEDFTFMIDGEDPKSYDPFLFDLSCIRIIQPGNTHSKRISGPRKGLSIITVTASYSDNKGEHKIKQSLNF